MHAERPSTAEHRRPGFFARLAQTLAGAWLVAGRELRGHFLQPVAYVVLPAFLVLVNLWQFVLNPFFVVERATVRPLLDFIPFLFTFFVPAIAMRSFAEPRRTGTLEVWFTWPLSDGALVLGKFLGTWALVVLALGLTLTAPLSVAALGDLDLTPVVGGYLGLALVAAACVALSLLASALTANQIVAFVGGFVLCFAFYMVGRAAPLAPPALASLLEGLSFERRVLDLARGVLDSRDLVYFAAVTTTALALTAEVLHMRRWR